MIEISRINKFGYRLLVVVISVFVKVLFSLRVRGKNNLPENTDDLLITAPHSSYWDPPLIGVSFGPRYHINFIARKGLLSNPFLSLPVRTFATVIDRDDFGKSDMVKLLGAFKQKGLVCIFPEGTTKDAPPKSGPIKLAERTNRRFLPVKIQIHRSPLKFPFLFAPAEVIIGEPLGLSDLIEAVYDDSQDSESSDQAVDYAELSYELMARIRNL